MKGWTAMVVDVGEGIRFILSKIALSQVREFASFLLTFDLTHKLQHEN